MLVPHRHFHRSKEIRWINSEYVPGVDKEDDWKKEVAFYEARFKSYIYIYIFYAERWEIFALMHMESLLFSPFLFPPFPVFPFSFFLLSLPLLLFLSLPPPQPREMVSFRSRYKLTSALLLTSTAPLSLASLSRGRIRITRFPSVNHGFHSLSTSRELVTEWYRIINN